MRATRWVSVASLLVLRAKSVEHLTTTLNHVEVPAFVRRLADGEAASYETAVSYEAARKRGSEQGYWFDTLAETGLDYAHGFEIALCVPIVRHVPPAGMACALPFASWPYCPRSARQGVYRSRARSALRVCHAPGARGHVVSLWVAQRPEGV